MKTRAFAFILAIAITASIFSCGSGNITPETADTTLSDTTVEAVTTENLLADGLPEKDCNGKEFTIAINTYCENGYYAEEQSGDVLSDTIFSRNRAVEERFNVKLNFISEAYNSLTSKIMNTVLAGEDDYQLCAHHDMKASSWVLADILVNWNDIPYVDFSRPWWSSSNTKELMYSGVTLLAVGDFALTTIGRTYAIYFDKVLAETYKLPDMYRLVNDGKWTLDKLSEFSRDVYTDLNSNGIRDFDDMYGYTTSTASNIGAFLFSSGIKIIEDGKIAMNVERTNDLLKKLIGITQVNPGTFYDPSYKNDAGNPHYVGAEKMAVGTTLFASAMIETGIQYLRDTENDYGIIPYPKWDESQEDYITMVDGGYSALCVPMSVEDLEMSGIIAEALCAETRREVVPVYTEIALKEKGVRDEESIAMINYLLEHRVFDFGYAYDNWKGFGFTLEELVKEGNENFTSYYAANVDAKTMYYESVLRIFENYGK